MKTKAAVLTKLKAPLEIQELVVPRLQRGQILVRIQAAGLCGSQLFEAKGLRGPDRYLPHLLGHEASGTVADVGAGVTTVRTGDYVTLSWIKGRGIDAPGGQYTFGRRTINAGAVAVFTEYAVVAENRVTKISRSIPPDAAALLGCAVATGGGVVRNTLQVRPGSSLGVFGVGGIGAAAVMTARLAGCSHIVAVDVVPKKLRWVKKFGATMTINAAKRDPVAAIMKRFPGGLDYAIEAAGKPKVIEQAFEAISTSGTLAITGHPAHGSTIRLDPFDFIKGKRLVGTWGGATVPERDFAYYIKQYRAGRLNIQDLITHRFSLDAINKAIAALEVGTPGRILLEM